MHQRLYNVEKRMVFFYGCHPAIYFWLRVECNYQHPTPWLCHLAMLLVARKGSLHKIVSKTDNSRQWTILWIKLAMLWQCFENPFALRYFKIPGILQRVHVLCRCCLCKAQRTHYCQESVQWKLLALVQLTNCSLIHTLKVRQTNIINYFCILWSCKWQWR